MAQVKHIRHIFDDMVVDVYLGEDYNDLPTVIFRDPTNPEHMAEGSCACRDCTTFDSWNFGDRNPLSRETARQLVRWKQDGTQLKIMRFSQDEYWPMRRRDRAKADAMRDEFYANLPTYLSAEGEALNAEKTAPL